MQAPHQKQAKKALKRQQERIAARGPNERQNEHQQLGHFQTNNALSSSSPSPAIDQAADGGYAFGYQQQAVFKQSHAKATIISANNNAASSNGHMEQQHQQTQMQIQAQMNQQRQNVMYNGQLAYQQPHALSIVSPMGHMTQQKQAVSTSQMLHHHQNNAAQNISLNNQGATNSTKMFPRGTTSYGKSSKTSKAQHSNVPVNSLLQQQLRNQQNEEQQRQHHSNYPSQMQAINQKLFYPMPQTQPTSKSSRSRTQLGSNNASHHHFQQQMAPSAEMLTPLSVLQNQPMDSSHLMPNNPIAHKAIAAQSSSNIMMRQSASANLSRSKPRAHTAANTTMVSTTHQNNTHSNPSHMSKFGKGKKVSANTNQINSSLLGAKQPHLANQRGSTRNISRPMTQLQQNIMGPPMSVTPQGVGAYALPINLNATISDGYHHQTAWPKPGGNSGMIGSSRSNLGRSSQHGNQDFSSPSKQNKRGVQSKNRGSATPQENLNLSRMQVARSPPPVTLMQGKDSQTLQKDSIRTKSSSRRQVEALSSILTVTVLTAKLKVDTSGFLHTMQVYCQVTLQTLGSSAENDQVAKPQPIRSSSQPPNQSSIILNSEIKKTQRLAGTEPKWSECFVFDLKGASEYLLELSVWSTNYLVSDSCIGRAFLKFDGSHSETGSITNWLSLKSEVGSDENGEIFVSISKEAIPPNQSKADLATQDAANSQLQYKNQVQSTEECAAINGDSDEHNFAEGNDLRSRVQQDYQANYQMIRPPEESEVNSSEEEAMAANQAAVQYHKQQQQIARGSQDDDSASELEADEEGVDSPVDDIVLEEEAQKIHLQQHHQQIINAQYMIQQQQQQNHQQMGIISQDQSTTFDGELDEQLQAVQRVPPNHQNQHLLQQQQLNHLQNHGLQGYYQQPNRAVKSRNQKSGQPGGGLLDGGNSRHAQTFQRPPQNYRQEALGPQGNTNNNGLVYTNNNQQLIAYHTGGFQKQPRNFNQQNPMQMAPLNQLSQQLVYDDHQNNGVCRREDENLKNNDEETSCNESDESDHQHLNHQQQQQLYDEEDFDYDAEEEGGETPLGIQTPIDDLDMHQQNQNKLQQIVANPSLLMQIQHQNAAEELADLQNDFVEENARLRQEGINNDKIHKKLEREAKQIKHEKSNLKKWQASLKSRSKRIDAQEEQLNNKRDLIEKESVKVNKSMQKMRRIKHTLDQTVQLVAKMSKGEIFGKLHYEASLTQHNPNNMANQHDTSDDWLLAMQAHEFVTSFEQVQQMLEQVVSDKTIQNGATCSSDVNSKFTGGTMTNPATICTTQHQQNNSQSSMQNHEALGSSNQMKRQDNSQIRYQNPSKLGQQQFMSDDNSISGDRNMLQNIDNSRLAGKDQSQANFRGAIVSKVDNENEAYWTHSSIREIHAQNSNTLMLQGGGQNIDNSTPNLAAGKQGEFSAFPNRNNFQGLGSANNSAIQNQKHGQDRSAPSSKQQNLIQGQDNNALNNKPQSTLLSPNRAKQSTLYPHRENQSRFQTEVDDEADRTTQNGPNTSASQPTQAQAARELYERHLDVDLGDPDLLSSRQQFNAQARVQQAQDQQSQKMQSQTTQVLNTQYSHHNMNHQQMLTGTSMTPEPISHADPLQDDRSSALRNEHQKLFMTKQVTATQLREMNHNTQQVGFNQQSSASQLAESRKQVLEPSHNSSSAYNVSSTMARQQEVYNDLIGQMSKELQDIQVIKQNLVQMTSSINDQQTQFQQQLTDQSQIQILDDNTNQMLNHQNDSNSESMVQDNQSAGNNNSALEALKQQQMQFLMEQQVSSSTGQGEQHQPEEEGDREVEGYIWESMQRNAQRMQQLKTEKGIQDPVELERELLRNFQTNEQILYDQTQQEEDQMVSDQQQQQIVVEHQSNIDSVSQTHCDQDDQKFTQSYIIDTLAQQPQAQVSTNQSNNQQVQEQEDEFEFQFDPDFLNKINANMAMNDQIMEQKLVQPQQPAETPPIYNRQQTVNQMEHIMPEIQLSHQQEQLQFNQSTLQGEQVTSNGKSLNVSPSLASQQDQNRHETNSFISAEQVEIMNELGTAGVAQEMMTNDGGPSFIMDYSNNNDLRNSQVTDANNGVSNRVSVTAGQSLQGGVEPFTQTNQIVDAQQIRQMYPYPSQQAISQNGTGSGGAAPATQINLVVQHENENAQHYNFKSPSASRQPNNLLNSERESQKGSVVIPSQPDSYSAGLTSTVQKMNGKSPASDGSDSVVKVHQVQVNQVDPDMKISSNDEQQMTANDFEISNRSSARGFNEQEVDDISRMINESQYEQSSGQNQSVIYKDDKVYDQPKKAVYGIQPVKEQIPAEK